MVIFSFIPISSIFSALTFICKLLVQGLPENYSNFVGYYLKVTNSSL